MSEIIFEVTEDPTDGGYTAAALGHSVFTEGNTLEELRRNVREAVRCHFFDVPVEQRPKMIRLHLVKDELLAA